MVPDIAKAGHSFKGAMAYYLHDKRQEGQEAHPQTAERVAWVEMRNLACLTPETATRIMAATAGRADELKAAAGIKATGRKSTAHVYAYSLAWHPDEAGQLDRAEMLRAADQTLKALGAEGHQAVIVCHQDQRHPHVHVILNRVDPGTGKMLTTSNDRLKLSDWANAYERERGQIVTPKREEKRQQRERTKQEFDRAARPDRAAPDPTRKPRVDLAGDPQRKRPPSEAAILKELSDAQKARHKQEWADLGARNKAARDQVYSDFAAKMKAARADAWAAGKAQFAQLRQMTRAEWKQHGRETFAAARQIERARLGFIGTLITSWGHAATRDAAQARMKDVQAGRRDAVAAETKARIDRDIAALKEQRATGLASQRTRYTADRAALIERQDGEKAKMREAWRQVYERRGKDLRYTARQQVARAMEQKPMKREFDKARELAPAKQPAPHPHNRQSLSVPAPTPAPAGMPTPAQRKVQDVPEVSRAVPASRPAPSTAQKDFGQSAEKPMTRADYWNQRAKEKAADRKPERDRSGDRDFDRER